MRWLACALALIIAALGAPLSGAHAQEVTLTIAEARGLAADAFRRGNFALANRIGHQLLAARPGDIPALILLAATEPRMGRSKDGRKAGARAYRATKNPVLKFEAAYYTGRAAAGEERFGLSQLWLRRAYQHAETDRQQALAAGAFQKVRVVSPWRAQLGFEVSPSSNINGGSSETYLVVDGDTVIGTLSGTARALSGVRTAIHGDFSYALSRSNGRRTELIFRGYHSFNQLSDEAKLIAPGARGSDFNFALAEAAINHRIRTPGPWQPDTYELALGKTWSGGQSYENYGRITLGRNFTLSQGWQLASRYELELRRPESPLLQDRKGQRLKFSLAKTLRGGNRLHLSLSGTSVNSDDINYDYAGADAAIGLALSKPVLGTRLSGQIHYSHRNYDAYNVGFAVPGGRQDTKLGAQISLRLENVDYLGFKPVITLDGSHTQSNISRFDGQNLSLSVGLRSAF